MMDIDKYLKRNSRRTTFYGKEVFLPKSLWVLPTPTPPTHLFCKSKCGWQFRELCLKTQRQEMFPGVLTSTCSVMDANMSTSTVAAPYTASVLSDFKAHPRSSGVSDACVETR